MTPIELKSAYIGGGSREWACKLMIDLALCPESTGEVAMHNQMLKASRPYLHGWN